MRQSDTFLEYKKQPKQPFYFIKSVTKLKVLCLSMHINTLVICCHVIFTPTKHNYYIIRYYRTLKVNGEKTKYIKTVIVFVT